MKIIDFEQIRNFDIPPEVCLGIISEGIKNKDKALLPAKISMKPRDDIFCNVMPAIIQKEDGRKIGGVKVVTRYPERIPSLDSKIMLYDFDSGNLLALMDGNFIIAMRTGAVAVHSIIEFAKKDFATIGIMGLGNVARATLYILESVYSGRRLTVKLLKYKRQHDDFMGRFSKYENIKFEVVDDVKDLVKGSDVVISAVTYLEDNVCPDECFDKGVLVIPIHTRGFMNCDLFFDKVFADDTAHVCHFKYFDKFKYFAETCDVVNGRAAGRESDDERILAYNIGIAMHDINLADFIFEKVKNDNLVDVDMRDTSQKFWV